ncbi:class C sortase [Bifidobacterium sp. SO1]|uniref:class C sortase n=1 Tax=Bifidobacterium sp. SO1 TaxID=2809029 RepID=UPI001BDD13C2|nr:class C sortase [Bifidobacterium sp. SO1]MBT1160931.1 class C sortase [Bifidobacterium sp. SO1]
MAIDMPDWDDLLTGRDSRASRSQRTRGRRLLAHARHVSRMLTAIAVMFALIAFGVFGWVAVSQAANTRVARAEASAAQATASAETGRLRRMVAAAREYNERLASTPQVIGVPLALDGSGLGDFDFSDDADYQKTLDWGDGIMGTLSIPRIGLELPIRHGAGEYSLSNGLGHLHGTSMPVGGVSTHAVITGHRGLADKELFTRLDEVKKGDPFYIELGDGETLAYEVDDIRVVDPDDTKSLAISRGRDLVTLVTCTPIMLNTHRLLVTGHRAGMPGEVPFPDQAEGDAHPKELTVVSALGVFGVGSAGVRVFRRRKAQGLYGRRFHCRV